MKILLKKHFFKLMQNSQLTHILLALSKKESRELRKWLVSPIHNQRSDVVQLYEYLTSGNRLEDDKSLEKERIFRKLYPKEAYDDARMRQVIHFLQECIEDYFIFSKNQEDILTQHINLAKVYREKKLLKLHEKTMKRIEDDFQKVAYRNEEIFEISYLIEKEKSIMFIERSRAVSTNYQAMSNQMEITFISRKLKLACAMLSHQKIYRTNYDFGLIENILNYLDLRSSLVNNPIIKLYFHLYNIFKFPDEEFHFFEIKQVLASSEHFFEPLERKDIYLMIINYCISRINTGFKQFELEMFKLYQRTIESKIIFENGVLNPLAFRNIVSIGTALKQFEWVRMFIEQHQNNLATEYRSSFVQFSWAKLHFEMKDYSSAQKLLINFDINDMLINLSAKSILLKIYYEEGEFSALESLFDSMMTYINRKKIIAYHKIVIKTFISFTKKLVRLPPRNKALKERLRKQIEDANPLPERKWLLEQLDKI